MCGITGIFAPGHDAARLAFFGLYALQHRGQESAGIAVSDGGTIKSHRAMGLLSAIFDEEMEKLGPEYKKARDLSEHMILTGAFDPK